MKTALPLLQSPPPVAAAVPFEGPSDWHVFAADGHPHVFVADGSRVYEIDRETAERLEQIAEGEGVSAPRLLHALGIPAVNAVTDDAPAAMPIRTLSLAVAQKCNLGCTYCYAQEGTFGGDVKAMSRDVAMAAVERLLADANPGDRVTLVFLGGEPLLNRPVIREATAYAAEQGRLRGVNVDFSLTTNGTLLREDDGDFFERYRFSVTVSLDGIGDTHDQQRPFKGGRGSFEKILANVRPLLARQRAMQVSAKVTVTPRNLELGTTLDALIGLGFHSVGLSPMLASPTGADQMGGRDLEILLQQMIECGRVFERHVVAGQRYPFANVVNAIQEIHKGTHRPYPCGAGAGYLGVSATGSLSACHRFVDDPAGAFGDLETGVDQERQGRWLRDRHVHRQEPCRSCWARYLCGGGCHHEVIHRGRPACEYIRGWLHYTLEAYVRLLAARPDYFGGTVG